MQPLNIKSENLVYQALIGAGGIGTGKFFALDGNHTLGREESRAGHFLDQRDYCKLHIIMHYVQALLGASFRAIPIGRVGDDSDGHRLVDEMSAVGLDVHHVEIVPGGQTLFSFCFVYPDGSGGNMTTNDSVNATVDAVLIDQAVQLFQDYRGKGIVLAAPEAPLSARLHLLELAGDYGFFRASSLTSAEMTSAEGVSILSRTDLLAINADEAAVLVNTDPDDLTTEEEIRRVVDAALGYQSNMQISITAGRQGNWVWDGNDLQYIPAVVVNAVNTAGAGDAHFAGLLVGLIVGLSLSQAQELATYVATLSVLSPHTIHATLDRVTLKRFVEQHELHISKRVSQLLQTGALTE